MGIVGHGAVSSKGVQSSTKASMVTQFKNKQNIKYWGRRHSGATARDQCHLLSNPGPNSPTR
jgi:hypothetical protein